MYTDIILKMPQNKAFYISLIYVVSGLIFSFTVEAVFSDRQQENFLRDNGFSNRIAKHENNRVSGSNNVIDSNNHPFQGNGVFEDVATTESNPSSFKTTSNGDPEKNGNKHPTSSDTDQDLGHGPLVTIHDPFETDHNAETVESSESFSEFEDETTFESGMNEWDFTGRLAKYDLKKMDEADRPVPLGAENQLDGDIIIFQLSSSKSELEKSFPPLINASLSFVYYLKNGKDIKFEGIVELQSGHQKSIFNMTDDDLSQHNDRWVKESFNLRDFTRKEAFKMRFVLTGDAKSLWAFDYIHMEGVKPHLLPQKITTEEHTSDGTTTSGSFVSETKNETTSNASLETENTTLPYANATSSLADNVTTILSNGTSSWNETDHASSTHSGLNEVEAVATAIWNAFYVFLALFIACLLALIVLTAKHRWKDDAVPSAVATYNPRTTSYRLDKAYDNPTYESHPV